MSEGEALNKDKDVTSDESAKQEQLVKKETEAISESAVKSAKAAKSGFKNKVMIGLAGLLVVAGVIGYIAYSSVINSPEARLAFALDNLRDAESLSITSTNELDLDGFTSDIDVSMNYVKAPFAMSMNMTADIFITKMAGDVVYSDGNMYVRIGGLDGIDALLAPFLEGFNQGFTGTGGSEEQANVLGPVVADLIQSLDGQWIEISGALLKNAELDIDSVAKTIQDNLDSVEDPRDGYKLVEEFENEMIDGTETVHFSVMSSGEGSADLLGDIFSGVSIGGETLTREEIAEATDQFGLSEDSPAIEVWIDPSTNNLLKIKTDVGVGAESMPIELMISNYNAASDSIEVPEDSITVLQLIALIQDSLGDLGLSEEMTSELFSGFDQL